MSVSNRFLRNSRVVPGAAVETTGNGGGVAVGGAAVVVESVPRVDQWDEV